MKILTVVALVAVVLAIGTVFYSNQEGWSYFDALYFSVMTLTTVGYGDFTPSSDLSKAFTMIYVFVGIGIVFGSVMLLGTSAHERISSMTNRKKEEEVPRV